MSRPEGVLKSGPEGEEGNYLFCSFLVVTDVSNTLETCETGDYTLCSTQQPSHYQLPQMGNMLLQFPKVDGRHFCFTSIGY